MNWLSPKLKDNQKKLSAELKECCLPLLSCLNDRNPDVRKAAQEAILPFMIHTGFDAMLKAASKVDVSSMVLLISLGGFYVFSNLSLGEFYAMAITHVNIGIIFLFIGNSQ